MEGIKKIIKETDENGNEVEVEITEYPGVPVILVENEESNIPEENTEPNNELEERSLNDESTESI